MSDDSLAKARIGKAQEVAAKQLAAVGKGLPDNPEEELFVVSRPRQLAVRRQGDDG